MNEDEIKIDDTEAEKLAYQARITELETKYQKSESDKENYKKAFLSSKGKLPDETTVPVAVTPEPNKVPEDNDRVVKLEKELSELKLSLSNRPTANLGGEIGETKAVSEDILSKGELGEAQSTLERMKRGGIKMTPEAEKQFIDNLKLRKIASR